MTVRRTVANKEGHKTMRTMLTIVGLCLLVSQAQAQTQAPPQYSPFVEGEKMCGFTSLSSTDVWRIMIRFKKSNPGEVTYYVGKLTGKPATLATQLREIPEVPKLGDRPVTYVNGWMQFASPSGAAAYKLAPTGHGGLAGTMTVKSLFGGEDYAADFTCAG